MREDLKDHYRIFYMVKGHLDASPQTVLESYNGYIKRLWDAGSNGAPLYDYEEDFEQAWGRQMSFEPPLHNNGNNDE